MGHQVFRVVGPRRVCDTAPGGTVTIAEDSPLNVGALLEAGLIEPVKRTPKPSGGSAKNQGGEG
ncbi:hypothetical protein L3Q67_00975 [Saccharothrix sp. AJ9571]|nr:hypothetical protein L3Q67_00975 [Saccharothrix sp. AJ9571]